ncbi:hypothetical protein MARA_38140 [Mycolicibacterium arabiense]|uniref:Anti-sigma factor antagonist n=1 Tax=Mycolicibacterium arabiense TaxID=1286181 RepID=A0A7I7S246_9MYCO|nr:anti-anti-sigma factor [Mycolicibacterium arabiense]MBJ7385401.1 anti-anti-sigma factor [Mycolicibacterium sp.]MCV7371636.1 anti-anti-sigma factor [Mycolicibacterium arabiense]BBY50346.1 hypothetical protein MARA_38140 [Mycolicibacterium arabiense]
MTTMIQDFSYGTSSNECDRALVRAYSRQLATVVSVSGGVDSDNWDFVAARVGRHVLEDDVLLDLGGVDAASPECRDLLYFVDDACQAAGVDWVLVAAEELVDGIGLMGEDLNCAVARSVREGLRYFADVNGARRQALLPLLDRTA